MSETQQDIPTVLCVESERSRFAVSNAVMASGAFRIISATNTEAALRAAAAVRMDAVVFDGFAMVPDAAAAARQMRAMAPTVPHVIVCPSTEIKELSDPAGLTYIVDPRRLVSRLVALVGQAMIASRQLRLSVAESRQLRQQQRQLRLELRSQVSSLRGNLQQHKTMTEASAPQTRVADSAQFGFLHVLLQGGVQLSACKRCRAVVAIADLPADLEVGERTHRCQKAPSQGG